MKGVRVSVRARKFFFMMVEAILAFTVGLTIVLTGINKGSRILESYQQSKYAQLETRNHFWEMVAGTRPLDSTEPGKLASDLRFQMGKSSIPGRKPRVVKQLACNDGLYAGLSETVAEAVFGSSYSSGGMLTPEFTKDVQILRFKNLDSVIRPAVRPPVPYADQLQNKQANERIAAYNHFLRMLAGHAPVDTSTDGNLAADLQIQLGFATNQSVAGKARFRECFYCPPHSFVGVERAMGVDVFTAKDGGKIRGRVSGPLSRLQSRRIELESMLVKLRPNVLSAKRPLSISPLLIWAVVTSFAYWLVSTIGGRFALLPFSQELGWKTGIVLLAPHCVLATRLLGLPRWYRDRQSPGHEAKKVALIIIASLGKTPVKELTDEQQETLRRAQNLLSSITQYEARPQKTGQREDDSVQIDQLSEAEAGWYARTEVLNRQNQ